LKRIATDVNESIMVDFKNVSKVIDKKGFEARE
jgi:hypothetical protein